MDAAVPTRGTSWTAATRPASTTSPTSCAGYRPDDAVLSEEGLEDPRRFQHRPGVDRRPARRHPRVRRAGPARLGGARRAVGPRPLRRRRRRPARARARAHDGSPAATPTTSNATRPRLITSRTRAPYAAVIVANALGCDAVRLGSAGAKAMAVVLGEADIYVHDGGMYQWDSAAPAAVAAGRRPARQPHRRVAARLQRARSVAPRLPRVPAASTRRRS